MSESDDVPYKYVDLNNWPQPHTHAIGQITLEWNEIEREFERLVCLYIETDQPTARIITGIFGNRDKSELLTQLVSLKESSPDISDAVDYAKSLFHICRENRNHIAHSTVQLAEELHKITLKKPRKQNPLEDHELELDINQVRECSRDIWRARRYIRDLNRQISIALTDRQLAQQSFGDGDRSDASPPLSLPQKPPKPRKLSAFLQIVPNIDQPPPE